MSMTEQKRCEIKRYLLKHIRLRDTEYIKKAMESYAISKTTVYNYIRQLRENGEIVPTASGDFPYTLTNEKHVFYYSTAEHLEEDVIFDRDIAPLLGRLDRNVFDIWRYSFTEMMNNAIEHAQASAISCHVIRDAVCTTILICDNGVGIFKRSAHTIVRSARKPSRSTRRCPSCSPGSSPPTARTTPARAFSLHRGQWTSS